MKPFIGLVMAIFLFGVVSLTAQSAAEPPAQSYDEISSLVMITCSKCHNTERICKNIREKNLKELDTTVTRMIEKGAALPVEKKDLAIDYLLSLEKGSKPICP